MSITTVWIEGELWKFKSSKNNKKITSTQMKKYSSCVRGEFLEIKGAL